MLCLQEIHERLESCMTLSKLIHPRGLQGLGVNAESYRSFLVPILLSKLPEDIKLVVSRQVEGENWKLDKLLEILKIEVEARERCAFMNVDNPVAKSGLIVSSPEFFPYSRKFTSRGKYQASASALFTSSNATKSTTYCLFRKQGHYPADCQIVTNLSERRNILKKLGRCFNCMRKGHISRQCDTSIKCNFCKDKHHAALCLKKFKSVESGCTSKGTTALVIPEEKVKEEVVEKKGSQWEQLELITLLIPEIMFFSRLLRQCVIDLTTVLADQSG